MRPVFIRSRLSGMPSRQRGVVLFFALVALVVMSLAAVALIRTTDTSTMIAGNLALKQGATTAGDAGTDAASIWLATVQSQYAGGFPAFDANHPLNNDSLANGYYATMSHASPWNNSVTVGPDANGYTMRYIIERMCNSVGVPTQANCLVASMTTLAGSTSMAVVNYTGACPPGGCTSSGYTAMMRITVRISDEKNTSSEIQSFVY